MPERYAATALTALVFVTLAALGAMSCHHSHTEDHSAKFPSMTGGEPCPVPGAPLPNDEESQHPPVCDQPACTATADEDYEPQVTGKPSCDRWVEIDGKIWSVCSWGAITSQPCARCYAASLAFCGYDDWRLPTIEELASLYDPHRRIATHVGDAFIQRPFVLYAEFLWSSEAGRVFTYGAGEAWDIVPGDPWGNTALVVRGADTADDDSSPPGR